jgi:hypothetical protein
MTHRLPNRTLTSIGLLNPDALDGRGLIAAATESLVQVAQVLVKVLGILRRRHPIDPCGTRLARVLVRLPQNVCINQVSKGRKDPARIMGGLRRKALEFWCDGW